MPWGLEIPLDPFLGIIATAPPPAWGRCGSPVPRSFGGNMDNKELRPGTTLYLPIFNEGALFFAGDGHGVQGDGEVCITALETGVTGTFRLTVRKDRKSTRLNSSHANISYAVFCLEKKNSSVVHSQPSRNQRIHVILPSLRHE